MASSPPSPPPRPTPWAEALSALLLGAVLVGSLLAATDGLRRTRNETARLQDALSISDAAARAAGLHAGDAAARTAALGELERRHAPTLQRLFAVGGGGVDDFGISRGAALVWGAEHADPALKAALLEHAKDVQVAGETALKNDKPLDTSRLFHALPDGRHLVAVPFRAQAAGRDVGGVAGAVLRKAPDASSPTWLWTGALLVAALAAGLTVASPLQRKHAGMAALLLGGAVLLLLAPPVPPALAPGVTILAGDWLVPHGPVSLSALPGIEPWLYLGGALLAAVRGLGVPGLADLLRALRRDPVPYLYVGPALAATAVLVFVPFAVGVGLSFVGRDGGFVGLQHYLDVLRSAVDPESTTHFFRTLAMTVLWTLLNVTLHVTLGLALALVLNRPKLRGRALYRLLLVVPWAVPSYITALTWKWLFNTQYGPINAMLALCGVGRIDWLGGSVVTNFAANLATNVWLGFPFMMVVSLGALQSIPSELYEAADIDGASAWQKFRHVTLPLLRPALFPAVVLGTIWTFNAFNVIYLVSGGGPDHQTDILVTEAYYAFKVLRQTGLAAAYSVLIFLLLLGYTLVTSRRTRATEAVNA